MNEDVNGSMKLFWKDVSNVKEGKEESCSRIKDLNLRLAQGKDEMRKIWEGYFEDLYDQGIQEQVAFHMCGFDGIRKSQLQELRLR